MWVLEMQRCRGSNAESVLCSLLVPAFEKFPPSHARSILLSIWRLRPTAACYSSRIILQMITISEDAGSSAKCWRAELFRLHSSLNVAAPVQAGPFRLSFTHWTPRELHSLKIAYGKQDFVIGVAFRLSRAAEKGCNSTAGQLREKPQNRQWKF